MLQHKFPVIRTNIAKVKKCFKKSHLTGWPFAKSANENGLASVSAKTGLSTSGGGGSIDRKYSFCFTIESSLALCPSWSRFDESVFGRNLRTKPNLVAF
jgi:hypothetical protein